MTTRLTVEAQGTWLENFGAEIMLRTVAARLGERVSLELALDPRWGDSGRRCLIGAKAIFPPRGPAWPVLAATSAMVVRMGGRRAGALLDGYGVVMAQDCNALFDISGFAFSDQWGVEKARQRADRAEWYARRQRPVVAFPQAVGPFRDRGVADQFARFVGSADLVYLRDPESMEMARSIVGDTTKVRMAPDVTFDSPASSNLAAGGSHAELVIVPNARLLDRGGWGRAEYLELLADLASWAREQGTIPVVLVHSLEHDDRRLATDLSVSVGVEVVTPTGALEAKARLRGATLVVASRFHALMAALSQGVPVISVGWSHKYDALLERFGLAEFRVRPGWDSADVRHLAQGLIDDPGLRSRLASTAAEERSRVRDVWDEVTTLLR